MMQVRRGRNSWVSWERVLNQVANIKETSLELERSDNVKKGIRSGQDIRRG